ncbi:ABC transporter ATP-binding protein [Pseudonocardia sp. MH-G8]|uniref:ABC transporter ATP-binding protein n=1 Tax=Pseudonocardia sp. MH-G8 TaxID=1854588 RepID=UPI000BA157FA|nr:ABC transporter ATP-binding protein [Pseudonocardia sp. MH-G8]OZM76933.1 glutathione ABC transporter ATP-binding protein [Pseudonocardia sp. MH-G8]
MTEPVLSVRDLVTEFRTSAGVVHAVDHVSFDLYPGETLAVVGESGSGKSATVLSALGLIPKTDGKVVGGSVLFRGRDLLALPAEQLRRVRGRDIAMVFQDPMTSLNPVFTVGAQLSEAIMVHHPKMRATAARARGIEVLALVGLPNPELRYDQYPHEYSGGMRQRAMIAMAIINDPEILIADEPTTALDVTIQAQVLEVLRKVQRETRSASIIITHDLGVVAETADRVLVMYGGRIVESGDVTTIFHSPRHPYTAGLMRSMPQVSDRADRLVPIPGDAPSMDDLPSGCAFHPRCTLSAGRTACTTDKPELHEISGPTHVAACHFWSEVSAPFADGLLVPDGPVAERGDSGHADESDRDRPELLSVRDLVKHFPAKRRLFGRRGAPVRAVEGVSLELRAGETLGLVGESGSGKTTVGKAIMGLVGSSGGRIAFLGEDITGHDRKALRDVRRDLQIVFQDPYTSLDPKMKVSQLVAEPLRIHGRYDGEKSHAYVRTLLERVGLPAGFAARYPHQLSGGQRQRVGIARALALEPRVIVLDEPVSALDVSVQAQVINLLQELQDELGLAYLFIAHDLSVVHHVSDRVAVMYLGKIMEIGSRSDIYGAPTHPYTQALLSAVPLPDPAQRDRGDKIVLTGDVPSPSAPPSGCVFRTRCWKADDRCASEVPELADRLGIGHPSACHHPEPATANRPAVTAGKPTPS